MRDGFLNVAVTTPDLQVANCSYNVKEMIKKTKEMADRGVSLLAFPEFSLTGYTCGDLFLHDALVRGATEALHEYAIGTADLDMIAVVGMPLDHKGRLYNVAAVVCAGRVLGLVPKMHIPNYSEFYEARQFAPGGAKVTAHIFPWGESVPFGSHILFSHSQYEDFTFGIELCEDLWTPEPPSARLAMAGARIIVNLSASDELTGKACYRRELVKNQSARTLSAYLYADAGEGESTTDMVFAGHDLIVENGTILKESLPFAKDKDLVTQIDLGRLHNERRRMSTFANDATASDMEVVTFDMPIDTATPLTRTFERTPFVPQDESHRDERCKEILDIQSYGLAKRLRHTHATHAVIGLSGGLDSTLALLVTVRAFDTVGLSREGIVSVTMPCFGTTDRTYDNAIRLATQLGTSLREIHINRAVETHFADIGHDPHIQDITYENSQARERTQILMDIANQTKGLVIGTGDMSELALGWATYNGDHMSMYGVNSSVPKTLVRYLVQYYADTSDNSVLKDVLYDVLDTPVSPELLPPKDGEIAQKTEDIVGPYELHDFFLYYLLRLGYGPAKIYRLAVATFTGVYDRETILKWLSVFCRRFFGQQFKRSCLPDGPKVGTVSVSPRGDLRMPSDASDGLWQQELDLIRESLVKGDAHALDQ